MTYNTIATNKKIPVSFPQDLETEQRKQITELVNKILEPINKDASSWNAFVDFIATPSGDFVLIAKCDNEEVRRKMQELIDKNHLG